MARSVDLSYSISATQSAFTSGYTLLPSKFRPTATQENEFALEAFINNLHLDAYVHLNDTERAEFLSKIDALDLFTAVQDVNNDLATAKLENHFLIDFLENNDPKLLVGVRQKLGSTPTKRRTLVSTASDPHSSQTLLRSGSKRSFSTLSVYTVQSVKKVLTTEYRLNYRAKADMAEKAAGDVEKRIIDFEARAMNDIKIISAKIEELRFTCQETQDTINNFRLHFLHDQRDLDFLESASERQIDRKLRKFVNTWTKNARHLLGTMRLKITSLQENCQQFRNDLITKADLSGILGAVDFEQLIIKRGELLQSLDDKNAHMAGLKGVTGKASLAMAEEKNAMMVIDQESKQIQNKTVDMIKAIGKLEREAKNVENENIKDRKTLESLREQLERYEAPSVNRYIEKKDELLALEKEEKMLRRKNYILNMKLNNILKKCKQDDLF